MVDRADTKNEIPATVPGSKHGSDQEESPSTLAPQGARRVASTIDGSGSPEAAAWPVMEIEADNRSSATWTCLTLFIAATLFIDYCFLRAGGWGEAMGLAKWAGLVLAGVFSLAMCWIGPRIAFSRRLAHGNAGKTDRDPTAPEEYVVHGLGTLPSAFNSTCLYLDLVKRSVANILYEDAPLWFYDHRKQPLLATGFNLPRRIMGEDAPTAAHTMIGIRRLDNIQYCVEDVLRRGIPGDLIETGAFRGGATIFMRAILKAHGVKDRRVFVCDTFVSQPTARPHWFVVPFLQAMASVPSRWWRRRLFYFLQRRLGPEKSFPECEDPSDALVNLLMWILRNPDVIPTESRTGIDNVKSHFARYGLLDEQVVFLKGFFADTLLSAAIERLAVIRLDGDTYESTIDALRHLYSKLSSGGYCMIDDYHSFSDCERAVREFRTQRSITDEIVAIDNLAVYWQKS